MNSIKYLDCVKSKTVIVLYAFAYSIDQTTKQIDKIRVAQYNNEGSFTNISYISANELGRMIFYDEAIVWAGHVDNENGRFIKVSKLIPTFVGGKMSVTSISDDAEKFCLSDLEKF